MEYIEQIITWAGAGLAAALGAVAAIVSVVAKIKKSVNALKDTTGNYEQKAEVLHAMSQDCAVWMQTARETVKSVTDAYEKQSTQLGAVMQENDALMRDFEGVKQALLVIAQNTPILVGNGAAKQVAALLGDNTPAPTVIDEVRDE